MSITWSREGWRLLPRAVLLAVVVAAPVVASWHGLTALGRDWLGLGLWAPLVPLVLDAAALYAAYLSLRSTLAGDAAGVDRLLVWVYAGLSAALNMWHADAVGGLPAAMFFGVASVSAALMWERTLRAIRRRELRAIGAVDPPLPRFRLLRWLVAAPETWRAWRLAVVEGITSPTEALAAIREHRNDGGTALRRCGEQGDSSPASTNSMEPGRRVEDPPANAEPAGEVAGLSKADAVRAAYSALGSRDVGGAIEWLADRGMQVNRSYAYTVKWSPAFRAAPGGESQ